MNRNGPVVTHYSFDPILAEPHFGKADPPKDEAELSDALLKKTQQLTPSAAEQGSVQNLVSKVFFCIIMPQLLSIEKNTFNLCE